MHPPWEEVGERYHLAGLALRGHKCAVITGDILTRATIWLALGLYLVTVILESRGARREVTEPWARWCWTLGCAFYVAHVACAFHFFHGWSHAAAYADTARQTAAITGWNWGGGIYVNYAFTLAWITDVCWWWGGLSARRQRPHWINAAWHGFFWFMVFNATVVFGHGPVRWFGGMICFGAAVVWWRARK